MDYPGRTHAPGVRPVTRRRSAAPLGAYHSMLYTNSTFKAIAITLF
ncbi:MAG TPA: hypothetical protein VFU01_06965 [Gemmatimonadaceae bacterium]|nr:hypothetical protein [Gemmatimonadaceae bacterium]